MGWVADGVEQEGSQCLFANTPRCRSIIARHSDKISVGAFCQLPQPHNAAADESMPAQEQVPALKVLPWSTMSSSRCNRDLLPGTSRDSGAPYFEGSASSQTVCLAVWFPPHHPWRWRSSLSQITCHLPTCCVSRCPHSDFWALGTCAQLLHFTLSLLIKGCCSGGSPWRCHNPSAVAQKGSGLQLW